MVSADVSFELIRSRRRSLEVRVRADGSVQVRAPLTLATHRVEAFVDARRDWIREQQKKMALRPRPRWRDGDSCQYLGDTLTLRVRQAARSKVVQKGEELEVFVPVITDEAAVSHAVHEWWRKLSRTFFRDSIERQFPWFAKRGHSQPVLRVKKMRTRWGSLSQRGYINLNLALMQYPSAVIDYVVMHELCHLEHMHHGPEFHALMDQRMPDWRERKRHLDG